MKNLITTVFLVLSFNSFSQEVEIKSAELDKMVWDKINERLVSIGKKPIVEFEQGEMKNFSTRVCETLIPANAEFRHSLMTAFVSTAVENVYTQILQHPPTKTPIFSM